MTSDQYRLLLRGRECPTCKKLFEAEDMGMWSDAYGYQIDDSSFRFTLYGRCTECKKTSGFVELGIPEAPPGPCLKVV